MKPVAVPLVRVLWVPTARRIRPTYREVFTAVFMRVPLFHGMTCVNCRIFRLRLSTVAATEASSHTKLVSARSWSSAFFLLFNLPCLIQESRRAELQLLSRLCTFWKYFCEHVGAFFVVIVVISLRMCYFRPCPECSCSYLSYSPINYLIMVSGLILRESRNSFFIKTRTPWFCAPQIYLRMMEMKLHKILDDFRSTRFYFGRYVGA